MSGRRYGEACNDNRNSTSQWFVALLDQLQQSLYAAKCRPSRFDSCNIPDFRDNPLPIVVVVQTQLAFILAVGTSGEAKLRTFKGIQVNFQNNGVRIQRSFHFNPAFRRGKGVGQWQTVGKLMFEAAR